MIENDEEKLYKIVEFASIQNVDRATIYRWVKEGKVNSRLVGGVTHIVVEKSQSREMQASAVAETISALQQQLEKKDEQLKEKDDQIRNLQDSAQQQNAIIMQLSRNNERIQLLLEHDKEPFWRRWFSRRASLDE